MTPKRGSPARAPRCCARTHGCTIPAPGVLALTQPCHPAAAAAARCQFPLGMLPTRPGSARSRTMGTFTCPAPRAAAPCQPQQTWLCCPTAVALPAQGKQQLTALGSRSRPRTLSGAFANKHEKSMEQREVNGIPQPANSGNFRHGEGLCWSNPFSEAGAGSQQ